MKYLLKYLILVMLTLVGFSGQSQQIIWEKQFGTWGSDEMGAVCDFDSGFFMGIGRTRRFGLNQSGLGSFMGAAVIKFDSNGDTLFVKNLNLYCQSWGTPYIGRFWNGHYSVVVNVELPTTPFSSGIKRFPAVLLVNSNGEVVQAKLFPQYEFCIITGVKKTKDEGLMLSGYKGSLNVSHTDSMFAMKVNFLLEQEWANKYSNIANAYFRGQHLEPMAHGNHLVSGALGKRIYGMEVDSNGLLVSEKIFYQTPSNRVFNTAKLYQGFGNTFFSQAYYLNGSNQYVGHFARHDAFGNKIWGGEQTGMIYNGLVLNREGSVIFGRNGPDGVRAFRISKDSSVIWDFQLGAFAGAYRYINGLCFTVPDTGILYGFFNQNSGNLGNQFWIAKIAGVGTAYDPANPGDTVTVSAQERLFRPKDSPVLYPNPATETIRFQKLTQETRVAIYSSQGQKLLEQNILPEQVLDICTLPIGTYLYHLKMGERVFTGKFLKK